MSSSSSSSSSSDVVIASGGKKDEAVVLDPIEDNTVAMAPAPASSSINGDAAGAKPKKETSRPEGDGELKSGMPWHHWGRAMGVRLSAIQPFKNEVDFEQEFEGGPTTTKFMLFRRSSLYLLIVFYFLVCVLVTTSTIIRLNDLDETVTKKLNAARALPDENDNRDFAIAKAKIARKEYDIEVAQSSIIIIVNFVSWAFCIVSALKWKSLKQGSLLIRIAWAVSFATPFLLQIIPYRFLLDIVGVAASQGATKAVVLTGCGEAKAASADDEDSFCSNLVALNIPGKNGCPDDCGKLFDLFIASIESGLYGSKFGISALLRLAPAVLSLLPGLQKGALRIKGLLPYHPLPGLLALGKPLVYIPLLYTLGVVIYQAVGDAFFCLGVLFIVSAEGVFAFFGRHLVDSVDEDGFVKLMKKIKYAQLGCYLMSAIMFLIHYLVNRDFYGDLGELEGGIDILNQNPLSLIAILANILASTLLTNIASSDVVLRAMAIERSELLRRPEDLTGPINDIASIFATDRLAEVESSTH